MAMHFISYSGARAGQPNAHGVVAGERRICFDVGAGAHSSPYLAAMERPDAVWISHAHFDHCGGLPALLGRWPRMTVLATDQTAALLEFAMRADAVSRRRLTAIRRRIRTVPWRRFRGLPGVDGMRVMALPAGHVPGAAMAVVEFESPDGIRRVLYTGDFCTHDQAIVAGAGIPRFDDGLGVDAVISEAQLANDKAADGLDYREEVQSLVATIDGAPGSVLIGVASVGESVEVAACLARAGQAVMIDEYLEPIFEVSRRAFDSRWDTLRFGDRRRLRQSLKGSAIVVAPGDQFRADTSAGRLAAGILDDQRATVVVLNRARAKTGAGRLLATRRGDEISWQGRSIRREAAVIYARLLNHAARWQLKGFIRGVGAPQTFLVHGSTGARWGLKRALASDGYTGSVQVVESQTAYPF